MNKILLYLEAQGEALKKNSYEIIAAAKAISAKNNAAIVGLLINGNENQAKTAGEYGLGEVIIAKHNLLAKNSSMANAKVIAQAAKAENADLVLFSSNSAGLEIAPRVAVKLAAGYVSDCVGIEAEGNITFKKPVYAGKAQVTASISTAVQVASLRPNVFTASKASAVSVNIKELSPELSDSDFRAYVSNLAKNEGKMDILEADIIVSGGRGIKGAENYNLIENLASVLGGAVGASRAVVDSGWRPHSEQVGQTGKTVSPTMYVACGISGAIQHLAGMSTSKTIVAINKDKDAPIFKVCDYGIVGDMFNILPSLTEKIKMVKGK